MAVEVSGAVLSGMSEKRLDITSPEFYQAFCENLWTRIPYGKETVKVQVLIDGLWAHVKEWNQSPYNTNMLFQRLVVVFNWHIHHLTSCEKSFPGTDLLPGAKEKFDEIIMRNVGQAMGLVRSSGLEGMFTEEMPAFPGGHLKMSEVTGWQTDRNREQETFAAEFEKIKPHFTQKPIQQQYPIDTACSHFFALAKQRKTRKEVFEDRAIVFALGLIPLGLSIGYAAKSDVNLATHVSLALLAVAILIGYALAYVKWKEVTKEIDGEMCEQYMNAQGVQPGVAAASSE